MKVKLIDFEEAVLKFMKKAADTLPTTGHKLLAGVMLSSSVGKMEGLLTGLADSDGCIDTDMVRKAVKDGFALAGPKATFEIGDERIRWAVKPVLMSFTEPDVETALSELETRYR